MVENSVPLSLLATFFGYITAKQTASFTDGTAYVVRIP